MTGTPSSASESIVSRYSSTGGWYSAGECTDSDTGADDTAAASASTCDRNSLGMTVPPSRRRRRHVERGIAVEEADGDQREPCVLHRHHGPILGPGQVRDSEGVPQHDVSVDDRP